MDSVLSHSEYIIVCYFWDFT